MDISLYARFSADHPALTRFQDLLVDRRIPSEAQDRLFLLTTKTDAAAGRILLTSGSLSPEGIRQGLFIALKHKQLTLVDLILEHPEGKDLDKDTLSEAITLAEKSQALDIAARVKRALASAPQSITPAFLELEEWQVLELEE